MLLAWVLFPLVLLAVAVGCGLAVERAAGWTLPGGLLPSVGLAAVIAIASLTTDWAPIAPLTPAVVVLVAIVGFATSWRRLRVLRPAPVGCAIGLVTFFIAAAPVILSGSAAFSGYFVLNDGSFHFALIDQLLQHATDLSRVAPSSYRDMLHSYIATAYPIGADVGLGAVRALVGQDVAWLFQPYMAAILALGAVALDELLSGSVPSRGLRAVCAVSGSVGGLVFAYYLEGSIKEVATTWLITVTVALIFILLRRGGRVREQLPLFIAVIAGLDVLELAIVPWLGPALAVYVIAGAWRLRGAGRLSAGRILDEPIVAATTVVLAVLLLVPVAGRAANSFRAATSVLTQTNDLGNLPAPLSDWQALGIWPTGDFRLPITGHVALAYALMGVALVGCLLAAAWMVRRRAWPPLVLLAGDVIAAAYLLHRASPYASGKVLMILSLAIVVAATLGGAALHDVGRRLEGWAVAFAVLAGVLWTDALAFRDASIASRPKLAELESIGQRFRGEGPSFYNLSDEYAVHFLRQTAPIDPEFGAPELRPGSPPPGGRAAYDPDALSLGYVEGFRLLVLSGIPSFSRPPANFALAFSGRWNTVWRREAAPRVLEHIPLGGGASPAAVPPCALVRATAARAAAVGAMLAYAPATPSAVLHVGNATSPRGWGELSGNAGIFVAAGPGTVRGTIAVPQAGRWDAWLNGSFSQLVKLWVDDRFVGEVENEIGPPGQSTQLGTTSLTAGPHTIRLQLVGRRSHPGDALRGEQIGPLTLVSASSQRPVEQIAPRRAASLCGRQLDWLEIVR